MFSNETEHIWELALSLSKRHSLHDYRNVFTLIEEWNGYKGMCLAGLLYEVMITTKCLLRLEVVAIKWPNIAAEWNEALAAVENGCESVDVATDLN